VVYASAWSQSLEPRDDFGYYFLRSAYRVGDFFHLPSITAVSTSTLARQFSSPWFKLSLELTCLFSIAFVAVVFYGVSFILASVRRGGRYGSWFPEISLFAAPLCWVLVKSWTRDWDWGNAFPQPKQPLMNPLGWILVCELAVFAIVAVVRGRRGKSARPAWEAVVLFVGHFGWWDFVFSTHYPVNRITLVSQYVVLALLPATAALALYCQRRLGLEERQDVAPESVFVMVVTVGMACIGLWSIWGPAPPGYLDYEFTRGERATIVLSRGPCYGTCPEYTVTIDWDGGVKYVARLRDQTEDVQSGTITEEQYKQILQLLRAAKFEALDDRAFRWAFDTPSVSVLVSTQHQGKTVVSDSFYFGAKNGIQERFVKTAAAIDEIVGSGRWRDHTAALDRELRWRSLPKH
jgi:hypothetical protein